MINDSELSLQKPNCTEKILYEYLQIPTSENYTSTFLLIVTEKNLMYCQKLAFFDVIRESSHLAWRIKIGPFLEDACSFSCCLLCKNF